MKIDNKQIERNARVSGSEAASEIKGSENKSQVRRSGSGQDSVALSGIADLVALAQADDASRSEKVSRIAAQYRSGSYVVNNEALGEALIDRAFED